jgi:DNA-binding NtrC family response regulator
MEGNSFLVFVIEDDNHLQQMILEYLQNKFPDILVQSYKTGEDALGDLNQEPHLIVLDYHLSMHNPEAADGLTILSKIRQLSKSIRVVLFTGQEDPEIAAAAMKMGAYDYVVKNQDSFEKLGDIVFHLKKHFVMDTPAFNKKMLVIILIGIVMLSILFFFKH